MGNPGLKIIKEFEGLELEAYPDPGSRDGFPWTLGFGHTKGVKEGDTCTPEQADAWLVKDTQEAIAEISLLIYVPLNINQHGALTSFVYNVGRPQFMTSTLRKKINAQDYTGAAAEFPRWNQNDGKIMGGLVRRRKAERNLWEKVDPLAG